MRMVKASILGLMLASMHAVAMAHDDDADAVPTIVVSATGMVEVKPDQVQIRMGVSTENKKVLSAAEENAKKVAAVLAALEKAGVQKDELSTAGFTIQPVYDYHERARTLTGYFVENNVLITTDRLDAAGAIIDAAVQAGATNVAGVSFGLKEERTRRDEVLRIAVANARADAVVAAEAAGRMLGAVKRILIGGGGGPPTPMPYMSDAPVATSLSKVAAPELMPGDMTVAASVTIEYELTPKAP